MHYNMPGKQRVDWLKQAGFVSKLTSRLLQEIRVLGMILKDFSKGAKQSSLRLWMKRKDSNLEHVKELHPVINLELYSQAVGSSQALESLQARWSKATAMQKTFADWIGLATVKKNVHSLEHLAETRQQVLQ